MIDGGVVEQAGWREEAAFRSPHRLRKPWTQRLKKALNDALREHYLLFLKYFVRAAAAVVK